MRPPAGRFFVRPSPTEGYRFTSLILGIVKSVLFQMRRSS
jgi:hypothetical protein